YLLFNHLTSEFTRLLHPQALAPIRLRKQAVPANVVTEVLGFVGIYGVGLFAGTLLLTATGVDWVSSLSAVVSTLSGVGPGMNALGPFDNYGWLEPAAKWVLMGCMLLGRLEFFSLLILLSPAYWRR
ncbi:MAG: potassium transporter TrkG, partial [Caldilinea sp.]